jgi:beta-glucanase (GH16 family)
MSYGSDGAEFIIQNANEAPTISSTKYIFFGKVTATIKACTGYGLVSSFILESDDLDEIDWEWLGASNTNVESNFFGKGDTTTYDRAQYHDVATPQDTWHTYTIDWTSAYVKWYIDNALVRTLAYDDPLTHNGNNFPQTPMMIKMGNWVGCANVSDTSKAGTCQWAAPAGGQADFSGNPSYTMYVKDVTIQDYGSGTEYTYSDMSGSFESIKSSGGSSNGTGASSGVSSAAPSSSPIPSASTGSVSGVTTTSLAHSSGTAVVPSATVGPSGNPSPSESASASTTANATATGSGGSGNTSGSGSGTASGKGASTLTSLVTGTGTDTSTPKASDTASKTTSSTPITASSSSQANSNKEKTKKYGAADFAVIALGLGLGYLVM